jgi:hypothetical protein
MFRSMKLMMDAVGYAVRSGQGQQGHQGRHRHGASEPDIAGFQDGGTPAQDFYVVVPNRP